MVYFVITGTSNCPNYIHAIQIANYLYERLPNFEFSTIEKNPDDWTYWIVSLRKQKNWLVEKSPIIWKEISMRGGQPYLIGGLSEFWEYIFDYYGLRSTLTKADIENLLDEHVKLQNEEEAERMAQMVRYSKNIIITGSPNPAIKILVQEILCSFSDQITNLKLYFYNVKAEEAKNMSFLQRICQEIREYTGNNDAATIIESLREALQESELMIMMDDYARRSDESEKHYLVRCSTETSFLAEEINLSAKRTLRIIVAQNRLACFNATVLVEKCTRIKLHNIVAVTGDLGLSGLKVASEISGIPLENMWGPPVWGFIEWYIDIASTIIQADVFKPYKRAIKDVNMSTLPNGKIISELRLFKYKINDINAMQTEIDKWRQKVESRMGRSSIFAKVRATMELLKAWRTNKGVIMSLGICSDGTFGIPPGIVFSQPAKLTEGKWIPYGCIPVTDYAKQKIAEMSENAVVMIKDTISF